MNNEQKVLSLIEKLNALASKVLQQDYQPADIEIDLLKHYLRDAYDAVNQLNASNGNPGGDKGGGDVEKKSVQEAAEPVSEAEASPASPAPEVENVKPQQDSKEESEAQQESAASTKEPEEKEEEKATSQEEQDIKATLNDRFKKQEVLLSERVADRGDLRKIIDLNKRYLYVNELFDGDEDQYERAITALNKMPDYQRAAKYVAENLENQNNWREHQKYRDLFYRSLQKRFGMKSGSTED
jgi:hypothetical protein